MGEEVKHAAAVLFMAAMAGCLCAGDGGGLCATNGIATTNSFAAAVSTNDVLQLWIDVPTNTPRSLLSADSGMTVTNGQPAPDCAGRMATSSTWRTTVTIETGFFHEKHGGFLGYGRRCEDGWYQRVGVGLERALDRDSGLSVGVGAGVGRTSFLGP
jgi:hypothetical protein